MSEPPECEGDEPFARGHRTRSPPAVRHRLTSFYEEREAGAFSSRTAGVKPNHWRALLFDSTILFAALFWRTRNPHGEFGESKVMIRIARCSNPLMPAVRA